MKKIFTLLALAACCAAMTWGCSDDKYDDTEIRQEIENLKQEIASMKEQVNSLKTIIDALNENKFITNYTEAADGSCTITFNDGKTITLHNGKDGAAAPVRQGFEPITLTTYTTMSYIPKFQIGNETVTIFRRWACPTLTAVCLPNFQVQR